MGFNLKFIQIDSNNAETSGVKMSQRQKFGVQNGSAPKHVDTRTSRRRQIDAVPSKEVVMQVNIITLALISLVNLLKF